MAIMVPSVIGTMVRSARSSVVLGDEQSDRQRDTGGDPAAERHARRRAGAEKSDEQDDRGTGGAPPRPAAA